MSAAASLANSVPLQGGRASDVLLVEHQQPPPGQVPPIKRFRPGFSSMRVSCGGRDVTPIHPFKIEQRISVAAQEVCLRNELDSFPRECLCFRALAALGEQLCRDASPFDLCVEVVFGRGLSARAAEFPRLRIPALCVDRVREHRRG